MQQFDHDIPVKICKLTCIQGKAYVLSFKSQTKYIPVGYIPVGTYEDVYDVWDLN